MTQIIGYGIGKMMTKEEHKELAQLSSALPKLLRAADWNIDTDVELKMKYERFGELLKQWKKEYNGRMLDTKHPTRKGRNGNA